MRPGTRSYLPWFAVFDFESVLQKVDGDGTEKLQWTHKHLPISVSVCSNVPGFTSPRCFVNADMDKLLSSMIGELRSIQSACSTLAEAKWGKYADALKERMEKLNKDVKEESAMAARLERTYGRLKGYTVSLPVLGFNSASTISIS